MLELARQKFSGDTMVEVLLAMTIAAFAIGITYATAQRGLNQSITARERGEALNIMQNQLTDLRLLYQTNAAAFNTSFGSKNHFCLTDTATTPISNTFTQSAGVDTLQISPYNANCVSQKTGDGVAYFIDIQTAQLPPPVSQNPTVYQVFVRWSPIGGGQINQASLFYRLNGGDSQTLGYALPDSLAKLYAYRGTTDAS